MRRLGSILFCLAVLSCSEDHHPKPTGNGGSAADLTDEITPDAVPSSEAVVGSPFEAPPDPVCTGEFTCTESDYLLATERALSDMHTDIDAAWADQVTFLDLYLRVAALTGHPIEPTLEKSSDIGRLESAYSEGLEKFTDGPEGTSMYCGPGSFDLDRASQGTLETVITLMDKYVNDAINESYKRIVQSQTAFNLYPGGCLNEACFQHDRCYETIQGGTDGCEFSSKTAACDDRMVNSYEGCQDFGACDWKCTAIRGLMKAKGAFEAIRGDATCEEECKPVACEDLGFECGAYLSGCSDDDVECEGECEKGYECDDDNHCREVPCYGNFETPCCETPGTGELTCGAGSNGDCASAGQYGEETFGAPGICLGPCGGADQPCCYPGDTCDEGLDCDTENVLPPLTSGLPLYTPICRAPSDDP